MPGDKFDGRSGRTPQYEATRLDAYERTADLLGDVAVGVPVHEALMMAYYRGAETGRRDVRAVTREYGGLAR